MNSLASAASPKNIVIVPKQENDDINSSILSRFNNENANQTAVTKPTVTATKPTGLSSQANNIEKYSPYIQVKSNNNQASVIADTKDASNTSSDDAKGLIKEISSNEEPAQDIELKVFKHKEVNSLIRNRILSLENCVQSKEIVKPPMQEVDKTIKQAVLVQNDEEIIQELKSKSETEDVRLPTATIKALAQSMQNEHQTYTVDIKPLPPQPEPVTTQSILKEPEKPEPKIEKQYSFNMKNKFHEEKDDDGWQAVGDVSNTVTESESESTESETSESEVESEVEPPPKPTPRPIIKPPPSKKEVEQKPKPAPRKPPSPIYSDSDISSIRSDPERLRTLDPETVYKILNYERYEDYYSSDNYESFEDYLRRRADADEYDTESYTTEGSEAYSDYSEYTLAGDNDSFVNREYDDVSIDSRMTYQSDYTEAYTVDSRGEYYTDDDDNRTLVDENEYTDYGTEYDGESMYSYNPEYDPKSGFDHGPRYDDGSRYDNDPNYDNGIEYDNGDRYDSEPIYENEHRYDTTLNYDNGPGYDNEPGYNREPTRYVKEPTRKIGAVSRDEPRYTSDYYSPNDEERDRWHDNEQRNPGYDSEYSDYRKY